MLSCTLVGLSNQSMRRTQTLQVGLEGVGEAILLYDCLLKTKNHFLYCHHSTLACMYLSVYYI